MLITIQYPFVDLRNISKQNQSMFFFPFLFKPTPKRPNKKIYLRHFGSKHIFIMKNDEFCTEKDREFFDSKKIISISPRLEEMGCTFLYARLFADAFFLHFDIGIRIESEKVKKIMKFLKNLFNGDIFSSKRYIQENFDIISICEYIKGFYIYATTKLEAWNKLSSYDYIKFGKPCIIVDYQQFSNIAGLKPINYHAIDIYSEILNHRYDALPLWIIKRKYKNKGFKCDTQRLRGCLLRVNTYYSGLPDVFRFLESQDSESINNGVITKFKYLHGLFSKGKYFGFDVKNIISITLGCHKKRFQQDWDYILTCLAHYIEKNKGGKKVTTNTIHGNVNGPVTFNGDNTGDYTVEGNINQTTQTSNDTIENDLEAFIKALSEFKASISDEQAVNQVNDLEEDFVNGVKSKKKKTVLSNVWNGIKVILENVSKNGSGIAALGTLVAKILKWL